MQDGPAREPYIVVQLVPVGRIGSLKETQSDFSFPPAVADENGDPVIRSIVDDVAVLVNIRILAHYHHAPLGDVGGVGVDGGVDDGGGGHFELL